MKNSLISYKSLFICCFFASLTSHAIDSSAIEKQADTAINQLYHRVQTIPNTSITDRIEWFSAQFKDAPYLLGSLGEGPTAQFDQYPRYRIDAFDCDTYVNTVLSLAQADSLRSFQHCINLNRYKKGRVSYINRNHFTSVDWNINNQQRSVLKDITLDIKDQQQQPVAKYAVAKIDKSNWYAFKTLSTIRLQKPNKTDEEERLAKLKDQGKGLGTTISKIPYLPLTSLFENNQPNLHLFSQIPNGAVIEIIRPNWDLRKEIGTALNVSHLGFAIWNKNTLYFREASSQFGKVVDVPLIDYLQDTQKSPTIKGINVQIVMPEQIIGQCR